MLTACLRIRGILKNFSEKIKTRLYTSVQQAGIKSTAPHKARLWNKVLTIQVIDFLIFCETGIPLMVKYLFNTSKLAVLPPLLQLTTVAPTFICFEKCVLPFKMSTLFIRSSSV